MAETKRLKFLVARGYGGMYFAAGAEGDIPEPWASHFLNNGTAELVGKPAETPKAEPVAVETKPKSASPRAKGKKK